VFVCHDPEGEWIAEQRQQLAPIDDYPMIWRCENRGGYGYITPVLCRVVREGPKRVQIAALKEDGSEALRWVDYRNLRPRGTAWV
jgi:hypothetical protein